MADIDLIPVGYRTWLNQRAIIRNYSMASLILSLLVFAVSMLFSQLTSRTQERVVALQSENAITQQQQLQLQQLEAAHEEYERRWSMLRGLRAGAEIDDIFLLIDRSLDGRELWFLEWSFHRAGVDVDDRHPGTDTGYFLILPDADRQSNRDSLEVETHMTIRGQARDHQALSTFVRTLFEQDDVKDVNVRRTSLTQYGIGRVVEFDMAIVLKSAYMES